MEPPFPGMDPYLERPSLWPDVHNSLIYVIREQVQQQLGPRYKATITPYISLESLEGVALRQIYVSARYERQVDYRAAPPPPEFASDDAAWLDAHLHERGLRA